MLSHDEKVLFQTFRQIFAGNMMRFRNFLFGVSEIFFIVLFVIIALGTTLNVFSFAAVWPSIEHQVLGLHGRASSTLPYRAE